MSWPHENPMSYNMPVKVHINPNFRGKTAFSGVQGNRERPVGIHFNPHWKPKTEGWNVINQNGAPNAIGDAFNTLVTSAQRRTIHINPKVIPNGVPHSISTLIQQEHMLSNTASMPVAVCEGVVKQKSSMCQTLSSEGNNAIASVSHKKMTELKPSVNNSMTDSLSPAHLNRFRKNINSANSPAVRTAKVVRSKYKYLSNTIPHHVTPQNSFKLQTSMVKTCPSSSRFKYVKKTEVQPVTQNSSKRHIVSRFKLVKGAVPSRNEVKICPGSSLTPRRVKAQKMMERVKGIPEHTVKSRYKLSKGIPGMPKPIVGFSNRYPIREKPKTSSRYKLVRSTTSGQGTPLKRKSPRALKSRFKIVKGPETRTTRYRLVRHPPGTPSYKQKFYQPISPFGRRNRWVNSRLDLQATKVVTTNRKLLRIGRRPDNTPNKTDKIRKAKLLSIGGVFYRSTRTTLTRSSGSAAPTLKGEKKPYRVKGQVLSIRGSKFVLDKTGRTLQRLTPNKVPISRIHIGGVTFVPSSENTLVRSNVHEARNLVSQAKQKSIAVLTSKLRKNNQPCLIYQRLGKCRLRDKGRCPKVHDPRKRAICNDFVNGKCTKSSEECHLSHDVGPEKMPTCHFFLEGCCVRDACPYLHVKLNKKAAVCRDFLSGYCTAGDKCKKRHVFLCPEFEETKHCSKGKYCTYRHAGEVRPKSGQSRVDLKVQSKVQPKVQPNEPEGPTTTSKANADSHTRYYLKNDGATLADKKVGGCDSEEDDVEGDLNEGKTVVLRPERSKLGDLPGFIPL